MLQRRYFLLCASLHFLDFLEEHPFHWNQKIILFCPKTIPSLTSPSGEWDAGDFLSSPGSPAWGHSAQAGGGISVTELHVSLQRLLSSSLRTLAGGSHSKWLIFSKKPNQMGWRRALNLCLVVSTALHLETRELDSELGASTSWMGDPRSISFIISTVIF